MKLSVHEAEELGYLYDVFGDEVYISGYYGKESEFIVSECIYNTLSIGIEGTLVLKYDYFIDFK